MWVVLIELIVIERYNLIDGLFYFFFLNDLVDFEIFGRFYFVVI